MNAEQNKKQKLAEALETNLKAAAAKDDRELSDALDIVLADLTDNNAHTIAALLESQYGSGYDMDKVHRAYKAAQWELSGTR